MLASCCVLPSVWSLVRNGSLWCATVAFGYLLLPSRASFLPSLPTRTLPQGLRWRLEGASKRFAVQALRVPDGRSSRRNWSGKRIFTYECLALCARPLAWHVGSSAFLLWCGYFATRFALPHEVCHCTRQIGGERPLSNTFRVLAPAS